MTVIDVGCGMGFFSLPAAQMVGQSGKVICIDLQKEMVKALEKRVLKAGIIGRVETRVCNNNSLKLNNMAEKIDFVFATAVVHEVSDAAFFWKSTMH